MNRLITLFVCIAFGSYAFADETPAPSDAAAPAAPAPAAEEKQWYQKIKIEGTVDAYYGYRFQNDSNASTAPNEFRAFDVQNNKFSPAYAKLAVSLAPEPAGFRVDLAFGPTADLAASDIGAQSFEIVKHIQQAYASAKLFDKLTIDLGKFTTSAGAELIEANLNWLYSRTMLFTYGPYTHTGLRLSMPIGDMLTLQAGVVNGWDRVIAANSWKTFNFSALLKTTSGTLVAFNFYGGPHDTANRFFFDLVAQQDIGNFSVNLNGAFGLEGDSKWYGAALMAKFNILDSLRISGRVEYFGDPDGHRLGARDASYLNSTLGIAYALTGTGSVEIRPEVRHDQSLNGTPFVGGTKDMQTTVQLAMCAWF